MSRQTITIGCPSGYWGDAPYATAQLLREPAIQYLVFDYLAEITMSILARARADDPSLGYATDFVNVVVARHIREIAERGIRLICNAGGLNPQACAAAIRSRIQQAGLDLKVATVTGDDLSEQRETFARQGYRDMFSNSAFPESSSISSINAYLGAFPIARALDEGAHIVITGRGVDSAVSLGACIHEFGWTPEDWDRLAGGSLAGHLLECGPHATGGNFTDWRAIAAGLPEIGYPIAIVSADGSFVCTKPEGTGGTVSVGTVSEQMLYEIGDPQAYVLPDVVCDFSAVSLTQIAPDRVLVSGAKGYPATATYKVCATYREGYRGGTLIGFYGEDAEECARAHAESVFSRTNTSLAALQLPPLTETSVELLGTESHYGKARQVGRVREVASKLAVKHPAQAGVACFLRELSGFGLATPPGLTGFAATRPKPSPVVRLFSFLLPKSEVSVQCEVDGVSIPLDMPDRSAWDLSSIPRARPPDAPAKFADGVSVPLVSLAWARSGDKGNNVNIGVIARKAEYLPYIWQALTESAVRERFAHFVSGRVDRYSLPGSHAMNFVLHDALGGGGVASLRMDPQGKGFAQLLLSAPIEIPRVLAEGL